MSIILSSFIFVDSNNDLLIIEWLNGLRACLLADGPLANHIRLLAKNMKFELHVDFQISNHLIKQLHYVTMSKKH